MSTPAGSFRQEQTKLMSMWGKGPQDPPPPSLFWVKQKAGGKITIQPALFIYFADLSEGDQRVRLMIFKETRSTTLARAVDE